MPKTITQYRVFIGSPGGLNKERERFRHLLERFTALHAAPRGAAFFPVGWEETLYGVGRPQELINADLEQCDYAVFALHDRWGSPTGSGHTSGTEEEWDLAQSLYRGAIIRDIGLFFKSIGEGQLRDPGEQLKKVLEFKRRVSGTTLFKEFRETDEFVDGVERLLSKWLLDHESRGGAPPDVPPTTGPLDGGYYSCFISYSSKDDVFVRLFHADLTNKGVRCWFAPNDLQIGTKIWDAIDDAIHQRDKVILILSENSIASDWVEDEVTNAFEIERKLGRTVLFPIRLDDAVMETDEAWAAKLRGRHIGDFRSWKQSDMYSKGFEGVLRDLTVKTGAS